MISILNQQICISIPRTVHNKKPTLVNKAERASGLQKTEWWVLAWFGLERGADLHMAQLMPLPLTVSCFS